jgi:hypothetical protein
MLALPQAFLTASAPTEARKMTRRTFVFMTVTFVAYHLFVYSRGLRFDAGLVAYAMQYIDIELLRNNLLESCFYLHGLPPLFNLFVGAIWKLPSEHASTIFLLLYLIGGFSMYLVVYASMVHLGISRSVAIAVSTLFLFSPSFILYENLLFYTFPTAILLALSVFFLLRFAVRFNIRWGLCFFFTLLFLSGIRSLFHLFLFCAVIMALLMVGGPHKKRIMISAVVPLVLLTSLYVKNYVIIKKFTAGSWMGMTLAYTAVKQMPESLRRELVASGELSAVSIADPFSGLDAYPESLLRTDGFEKIPLLNRSKKSTGQWNYHHVGYITISEMYLKDSLHVIRHYPRVFAKGVLAGIYDYFKPSSDTAPLAKNAEKIRPLVGVYYSLLYGETTLGSSGEPAGPLRGSEGGKRLFLVLIVGIPLVLLYGVVVAVSPNRFRVRMEENQRIALVYICFCCLYVAILAVLFATGESHRYRFASDPLYLILFALLVHNSLVPGLRALRRRLSHVTQGS